MPTILERFGAAMTAFRNPSLVANTIEADIVDGYTSFEGRRARYQLFWALYWQDAFRDADKWPELYRSTRGLYRYTRDLLGVASQLGDFWTSHLQGGLLDPMAGDGKAKPSALPIVMAVEDPRIREAIAELWKRSVWQITKDIMTLWGNVLADVAIEVSDDPKDGRVRLNVVHPGHIKDFTGDREGNCQGYELEYKRTDPRKSDGTTVLYNERVIKAEGGRVEYRTYLDGKLYPWPGNPGSAWDVELPFVPLVKIQHKNIGIGWGQAEIAPALSGSREVADLASCMTDAARKAFMSPHLLAGVEKPKTDPTVNSRPDQMPLMYGPPGSSAQSLLVPYDFTGIGAHLERLRVKLREDYPELNFERIRVSGDASAVAIREARKPAEDKVIARRVEYDDGSLRAFKMAITMGGMRGYKHYKGFDADSYDRGELDFSIGHRPVFAPSELDRIEEGQARAAHLEVLVKAGWPVVEAMAEAGYSDERIEAVRRAMAGRVVQEDDLNRDVETGLEQ